MTGSDDEFENFLRRRTPVFRGVEEDPLEPPAELDRIVLRQAREAIETRQPMRLFGARWGAPLALAATVLLAVTVILHQATPVSHGIPEVTVQSVAQREYLPAEAAADSERDLAAPAARARAEPAMTAAPPPTEAAPAPAWRRDSRTWLAEIERLRASGEHERAETEMAEYKLQNRAYAGSPDR